MKRQLLIVDDETDIRNSLARRYTFKGCTVDCAENGKKALEAMEEKPYQVVISDIMMPIMDGVELLRQIRMEYPMTRVIMMTGYVTLQNGLSCLRHGADTVIFKPFDDLKEMDAAIENAVKYLQHWEEKLEILNSMKTGKGV